MPASGLATYDDSGETSNYYKTEFISTTGTMLTGYNPNAPMPTKFAEIRFRAVSRGTGDCGAVWNDAPAPYAVLTNCP